MPLFVYNDGASSIETQLSAICAGAPISIASTGKPNQSLVTYPASHNPDLEDNPVIGHMLVYALANSSCLIEIWPITWDEGLPSSGSGTRFTEEKDAALVSFDRYPSTTIAEISYYAAIGEEGPFFMVNVQQTLGTGLHPVRSEQEPSLLMLLHLMAHVYLLVTGKYDPATHEEQALNIENIHRMQHFLSTRVDSHIERAAVYDLGGCGC
jgi:hypothetical protein